MLALWTSDTENDPRHLKGSLKIATFARRIWTCFTHTHTVNGDAIYSYTIHFFLWVVKVATSILIQKYFTL